VPRTTALKADLLAAYAHGLVFAAAGLLNNVFAIRFRTPFQTFVFSNLDFLLNGLVLALDLLGAKLLYLLHREFFSA
jgi:hypothetical protein